MKVMTMISVQIIITVLCIFCISPAGATVPAPPVNQRLGFYDTIFNNLQASDCRVCHDDRATTGPTSNVDRHHMLYGTLLPKGECSVNRNACLSDGDCNAGICSSTGAPCAVDAECPDAGLGETCGEVCIGETVVPTLDANRDGADDTMYGCLNCHRQTTVGGAITFVVERNCLVCHIQMPGEASVHHLTDMAQGRDSALGNPSIGDCTPCHGTLVDDIGDTHTIPTYTPSLVTPKPRGGEALPLNSRGKGAGACDYCHDSGADTVTVYTSSETHHNTGLFQSETGVINENVCLWCHEMSLRDQYVIRTCEGCHGFESLHNIQANSDGDCCVVVGGELAGYGHIGRDTGIPGDSDCWGCHGFSTANAPGLGPVIPSISNADSRVIVAGTDRSITLTGSSFTNSLEAYQWTSNVSLTGTDGVSINHQPSAITESSLTFTVPGTTPAGNYEVRAIKNNEASNPVVITIKPPVVISSLECNRTDGTVTISGSGFSEKPAGTDSYLNVKENATLLNIASWTDTLIQASGAACNGMITVNSLYSSSSSSTCDCEGNFDNDSDIDGSDATAFKKDYGRSGFFNPCMGAGRCNGDFDCDHDVDGRDAGIFKEDFGRNSFNQACLACLVEEWCTY
jgi:hypothetical protein